MIVSKEHRHLEGTNGPDVHVQFVMKKIRRLYIKTKEYKRSRYKENFEDFRGICRMRAFLFHRLSSAHMNATH